MILMARDLFKTGKSNKLIKKSSPSGFQSNANENIIAHELYGRA